MEAAYNQMTPLQLIAEFESEIQPVWQALQQLLSQMGGVQSKVLEKFRQMMMTLKAKVQEMVEKQKYNTALASLAELEQENNDLRLNNQQLIRQNNHMDDRVHQLEEVIVKVNKDNARLQEDYDRLVEVRNDLVNQQAQWERRRDQEEDLLEQQRHHLPTPRFQWNVPNIDQYLIWLDDNPSSEESTERRMQELQESNQLLRREIAQAIQTITELERRNQQLETIIQTASQACCQGRKSSIIIKKLVII